MWLEIVTYNFSSHIHIKIRRLSDIKMDLLLKDQWFERMCLNDERFRRMTFSHDRASMWALFFSWLWSWWIWLCSDHWRSHLVSTSCNWSQSSFTFWLLYFTRSCVRQNVRFTLCVWRLNIWSLAVTRVISCKCRTSDVRILCHYSSMSKRLSSSSCQLKTLDRSQNLVWIRIGFRPVSIWTRVERFTVVKWEDFHFSRLCYMSWWQDKWLRHQLRSSCCIKFHRPYTQSSLFAKEFTFRSISSHCLIFQRQLSESF